MRSIPLLAVDATDVFDEIAAAKHQPRRGRMQAARAEVLAAYQGYEDAVPEVGGLDEAPLTDLQKEAMRHAFTVETEPMTALRGDLLKRISVARCPLCGISESSTLDHYLPKEQYPEFSVFPKNLVPSCAVCNTRKRDRILDEGTNVRMFLHPCYDGIPGIEFLVVRARMEADALILSYRLTRPAGMVVQTFQHLRSHFNELDLADRYRRMGLEHLGGQYPALRRAYAMWAEATEAIQKYGAMVKSPSGYPVQSPYVAIANRQTEIMMRIASEFGFTPASRSRISAPAEQQPTLFDADRERGDRGHSRDQFDEYQTNTRNEE